MTSNYLISKYTPSSMSQLTLPPNQLTLLNACLQNDCLTVLIQGDVGVGKSTVINVLLNEYLKGCSAAERTANVLHVQDTGIQYCRNEVKNFASTRPHGRMKRKIIVLDNVDNMNEQNQQVFSSFIDKYANNIHIIASCTNPKNVMDTFQSRTVVIKLTPWTHEQMTSIAMHVMEHEQLRFSQEDLQFIIRVSKNSVKNMLTFMEKSRLLGCEVNVQSLCSDMSFQTCEQVLQCLLNNQLLNAIKLLYDACDQGFSGMDILDNFFLYIKHTECISETIKYSIIPVICKYMHILNDLHENEIELALFANEVLLVVC